MVCLSGPNWPPCVIAGCKVDSYYYYIDIIIFQVWSNDYVKSTQCLRLKGASVGDTVTVYVRC